MYKIKWEFKLIPISNSFFFLLNFILSILNRILLKIVLFVFLINKIFLDYILLFDHFCWIYIKRERSFFLFYSYFTIRLEFKSKIEFKKKIKICYLKIKPGGCDNALFSPLNEDNCGICGGENKSCKESSYTIETPNNFGNIYIFLFLTIYNTV